MTEQGSKHKFLGKPHKLVEGLEKVTGRSHYTGDLNLSGMLHARPILSPHAHAEIKSIEKSAGSASSETITTDALSLFL